jgi:hypothetical protein
MMKVESVSFRVKLTSGAWAFGRTFHSLRDEESYRVEIER